MRPLLLAVAVTAVLLLVPHARAACSAPPAIIYPETSTCPTYNSCAGSLCACLGQSSGLAVPQCFSQSNRSCTVKQNCLFNYASCLENVAELRTESTDCGTRGSAIYAAILAAATTYSGSTLQQNCQYRVCLAINETTSCDFGSSLSAICVRPSVSPTSAPGSGTVYAAVATLSLNGNSWPLILQGSLARINALRDAVAGDIANLLGTQVSHISILNITQGTSQIIVRFTVGLGAGMQPSTLQTIFIAASGNSNWLSATRAVYAAVSTEVISVGTFNVESTAAPGQVTPVPPFGAPDSPAAGHTLGAVAVLIATAAILLSFISL